MEYIITHIAIYGHGYCLQNLSQFNKNAWVITVDASNTAGYTFEFRIQDQNDYPKDYAAGFSLSFLSYCIFFYYINFHIIIFVHACVNFRITLITACTLVQPRQGKIIVNHKNLGCRYCEYSLIGTNLFRPQSLGRYVVRWQRTLWFEQL